MPELQVLEDGIFLPNPLAEDLKRVIKKAVQIIEWQDIQEPTITQTSNYLGVSVAKLKKDMAKIDCPLRKSSKGGKGRGNEIKFFKSSVEHYKKWL